MIVGGESGAGARLMKKEWVLPLRDQCKGSSVPFFFKQWGGVRKAKKGRHLEGKTYDEFPRRARHLVMSPEECALAVHELEAFYLSESIFPASFLSRPSQEGV